MLILGRDLAVFLKDRRKASKRPCRPGQLFCVRCRSPKYPAAGMAEYQPLTESVGNLVAICPDCDVIMNRRIALAKIKDICSDMDLEPAARDATSSRAGHPYLKQSLQLGSIQP